MTNIVIDNDSSVGYETNGRLKSVFNIFFIPFLNSLPAGLRHFVKRTNKPAKEVIEMATSHHAIEILYKYGEVHRAHGTIQRFFHYIWFSTNNPKAVRNRLRLVERELTTAINEKLSKNKEINILSVAAGSARAVVESLAKLQISNKKINVSFLDKNPLALDYSKKLTQKQLFKENYNFRWIEDQAKNFQTHYKKEVLPDIVETVGLMDYFDDKKVLDYFSHVYNFLNKDGIFITANISDNPERKFVTNLVGWNMIYRHPNKFYEIASHAGFKKENIRIVFEPLKVHFIMIAKK